MEGKKRKRKELSLKTSKKQAVWRTGANGGQTIAEQEPERPTNDAFQREDRDGTCAVGGRAQIFASVRLPGDTDQKIQLNSLFPICQRWEDLEDLPASEILGPEPKQNNCKDQSTLGARGSSLLAANNSGRERLGSKLGQGGLGASKYGQNLPDELMQKTTDQETEAQFGYTDLPKPKFSFLSLAKAAFLDVEQILKESDSQIASDVGDMGHKPAADRGQQKTQLTSKQTADNKFLDGLSRCRESSSFRSSIQDKPMSNNRKQQLSTEATSHMPTKASSSDHPSANASHTKSSTVQEFHQFAMPSKSCTATKRSRGVTQNSLLVEDTLQCCPICQCDFVMGTSRQQVDKHISECVEAGVIMDDEEDW